MEEYLPIFLVYMGVTMTITLIAHFVFDGLFSSESSDFGEKEFSTAFWVISSLLLPLAIPVFLIMLLQDEGGVRAHNKLVKKWAKEEAETKKRREEARAEVLKNPSVIFEKFKKGRTALKDYNHLIAILENSRNSDKDNSDEIVEIVREAYLAISEKKWTEKNKRNYEEKLMRELEELNNG